MKIQRYNYNSQIAENRSRGVVMYKRIMGPVIYKHGSFILKAIVNTLNRSRGAVIYKRIMGPVIYKHGSFVLKSIVNTLVVAMAITLSIGTVQAKPNIPSDMLPSPLFGATDFSQQMLRFEEFGLRPIPDVPTTAKTFPSPAGCNGGPDYAAMDAFLDAPLWPAPSVEANIEIGNPWFSKINTCLFLDITGVIEGRPPGVNFAHQRWTEFPPQAYFQTAQGGARTSSGSLDDEQSHAYAAGEFGPRVAEQENQTGLYNNTAGVAGLDGTTSGISIKFHPSMPVQDANSLWTFGYGTLPPKLLRARYGEAILFRHYNALPIDVSANNGFGEHTITTHEHNGHNPGESDGFAGAYFFPGQFYDYRWPMVLAGHDSINTDASDPRASTPCKPDEIMMIPDPESGVPVAKRCSVKGTVNIAGDWHETMSTHWFHDHMIDRTSENVYKGNAAMMNYYSGIDRGKEGFHCEYDDPAKNINLCFPSGTALHWGNRDYDVQLLVADKAWDQAGQLAMAHLNTEGFLGDRMTVNWLYKPYMDVRARRYRLRVLDGSVARYYKMAFVQEFNDATTGTYPGPLGSNKSYSRISFHMIANDGNIMEHAVPFPNAQSKDLPVMSTAERHDVIIDFSQFPVGTKLYMVNTMEHDNGKRPKGVVLLADILSGLYAPVADTTCIAGDTNCWDGGDPGVGKIIEFRVQPYDGTDLSMNPADYEVGKRMMIPLVKFTDAELAAATHRTFSFGKGGGISTDGRPIDWAISTDGGAKLHADVNRVDALPGTMFGGVEIWHIVNAGGGWAHPVHVHFEEGQYLLRGDPNAAGGVDYHLPPLWEIGARKDMYRVSGLGGPGGLPDSSMIIDVAIRFREFAGTFVEHCHNTTHEDKAMLLRWDNENPGQTVRIPTPVPEWDGVKYVGVGLNDVAWTREDGTTTTAVDELLTVTTGDLDAAATFVAPNQIQGDLNWDGKVNILDVGILKSQYRKRGLWGGDFNESVTVNIRDLGILKANYRTDAGFPLAPNDPFALLP